MTAEMIIFICLVIAIGSVFIMEIIKLIAKAIAKKKGKEVNMKKAEYILILLPMITTFAGIYVFLHYQTELSTEDMLKLCSIFAGSTQTIYTFVVQLIRKGIVGMVTSLQAIFKKKDKNATIVEQAQNVVDDMEQKNEEKKDEKSLENFLKGI